MRKIIILAALLLFSAELQNLPTYEEQQKIWTRVDRPMFSSEYYSKDSEKEKKLDDLPADQITEDNFARYYSCFGEGCIHVFKNKAGDQRILVITYTDAAPGDFYLFKRDKIPQNLDPLNFLAQGDNKFCSPTQNKCMKIINTKHLLAGC